MATHQDWNVVTWTKDKGKGKHKPKESKASGPAATEPEKKLFAGQNKASKREIQNIHKIEEDTGDYRVERVSLSFSQALRQARSNKKLSQAELAHLINEKTSVVTEYESGKATPQNSIIQKLNRALHIQLPSTKA